MPRLRRTHPGQKGLTRRRSGRGWTYLDADGGVVTDKAVRRRIETLVIPPAWQQVWITPYANGHLQAVGTDAAGRRQYLYHPDWQANRNRVKHSRVLELGAALPEARNIVAEHLSLSSPSRERVLGIAFRLLDRGHFRIGGQIYAETNGSYGLSTLRRDHVRRQRGALVFEYVAKSGIPRTEIIEDPVLLEVMQSLLRRRSGELDALLVYREGREWRRVTSEDINAYVKQVVGLDVSAKDFRTWHGTVLAAVAMADEHLHHPADKGWSRTALDKAVSRSVQAVAENLGNTPTVCRGSYINPRAIELFREGTTIAPAVTRVQRGMASSTADDGRIPPERLPVIGAAPSIERAVLKMLAD
ncbi:DNA topoisomerase IB [Nakamurella sp. GG22]